MNNERKETPKKASSHPLEQGRTPATRGLDADLQRLLHERNGTPSTMGARFLKWLGLRPTSRWMKGHPVNKDWWDSVSLLRTLMPSPTGEIIEVLLEGSMPEGFMGDVARVNDDKLVMRFDRTVIEADLDLALLLLAHQWALMYTLDNEPSFCAEFGKAYALCWSIISGLDDN